MVAAHLLILATVVVADRSEPRDITVGDRGWHVDSKGRFISRPHVHAPQRQVAAPQEWTDNQSSQLADVLASTAQGHLQELLPNNTFAKNTEPKGQRGQQEWHGSATDEPLEPPGDDAPLQRPPSAPDADTVTAKGGEVADTSAAREHEGNAQKPPVAHDARADAQNEPEPVRRDDNSSSSYSSSDGPSDDWEWQAPEPLERGEKVALSLFGSKASKSGGDQKKADGATKGASAKAPVDNQEKASDPQSKQPVKGQDGNDSDMHPSVDEHALSADVDLGDA